MCPLQRGCMFGKRREREQIMNIRELIKGKQELKELKWWDIAVVTLIMFGQAIYQSTLQCFALPNPGISGTVEFSAADNIQALISQLMLLCLGLLYLRIRNFDFSLWKFKITFKQTLVGIVLFIVAALIMDAYIFAAWNLFPSAFVGETAGLAAQGTGELAQAPPTLLDQLHYTTVLYAALNGMYEEIYFLGMCLFVAPKKVKLAFIFSLLVRFSFHTYQGWVSAIGISLLGIIYYFWYEKTKRENLYPFFLSHAIADVIGLGIMGYILR